MNVWIEAIGWISALLILGAYGLISAGKLEARTPLYQVMNILGAAGFVVNSGWNGALPSAAMNVVWACIGLYALARGHRSSKEDSEKRQPQGRAD
jgi:formate hydrogenlyase subunit 3/multisubunit Na+/H+ antiporter MnhD subunit